MLLSIKLPTKFCFKNSLMLAVVNKSCCDKIVNKLYYNEMIIIDFNDELKRGNYGFSFKMRRRIIASYNSAPHVLRH